MKRVGVLTGLAVAAAALAGCETAPPAAMPCHEMPVTGYQFQECGRTVVARDSRGTLTRYSLRFRDAQSEIWAMYFKGDGSRAAPYFSPDGTIDFFRSPNDFGAYLANASGFGRIQTDRGERFFDFVLDGRRCKGFVRFGGQLSAGDIEEYRNVATLFMCRVANAPISLREARFFTDQLKFQ